MIESSYTPKEYSCDGEQTQFPITFPYGVASDIVVKLRHKTTGAETDWTQPTHYTVSGGNVVAASAPSADYNLWIFRDTPQTQNMDFQDGTPPQSTEDMGDKLTKTVQELGEKFRRTLLFKRTTDEADHELPEPEDGYFLRWQGGVLGNVFPFGGNGIALQAFMKTFLEALDAAAARTTLGAASDADAVKKTGNQSMEGNLKVDKEIQALLGGYAQFRAIQGNYGFMIRNGGTSTYFLLTASGDQYGSYNSLRPIRIENATGYVFVDERMYFRDYAIFGDGHVLCFGTDWDYRIYHTGSHGYIDNYTGTLYIRCGTTTKLSMDASGIFTFVHFPITPSSAPTTDYQVANKKYVDDTVRVLLGSWGLVSDNVVYQASTDGFVLYYPHETDGSYAKIYTDGSNPPTTLRAHVKAYNTYSSHGSACVPVKKGDYYEVDAYYGTAGKAYWIPLE